MITEKNGIVMVCDLKADDRLLTEDGIYTEITEINEILYGDKVYSFFGKETKNIL